MEHNGHCDYTVTAEDNGEVFVCYLPAGHDGTHRLIEQYRIPSEEGAML